MDKDRATQVLEKYGITPSPPRPALSERVTCVIRRDPGNPYAVLEVPATCIGPAQTLTLAAY